MNCKYMNMLRVVRGNAFKLKIAVEAYTPSGRRIDSFALGEAVLKLDKNGTLTTKEYTILEGTTILVAFDGSESLGVYGFQMSGEYEGEAWRWANAEIFQIVESNVKAHIPEGCVLLDDTYNMALKIVLSGGDGITFTPSVSEQGIISWTNDGGLPNPEPRNIRGPRGDQGPQGEVGPQGPRGQMGLRGQIGPKGDKGDKGDTGATPVLDVTASVDENVGNPMVVVESFGPAEHRTFDFQFKNLKGQKGETGATGPQGPQGQQGEPGNYTKPASGIPLSDLNGNVASGIVYDVTANNSGATFASLSALLSSGSLSTLIPTSVRKGGMQIRFVQSSDNKYVQFRYMPSDAATVATFTNVANWQGVDETPTVGSQNLVISGGVESLSVQLSKFVKESLALDSSEEEDITSEYSDSLMSYATTDMVLRATETSYKMYLYNLFPGNIYKVHRQNSDPGSIMVMFAELKSPSDLEVGKPIFNPYYGNSLAVGDDVFYVVTRNTYLVVLGSDTNAARYSKVYKESIIPTQNLLDLIETNSNNIQANSEDIDQISTKVDSMNPDETFSAENDGQNISAYINAVSKLLTSSSSKKVWAYPLDGISGVISVYSPLHSQNQYYSRWGLAANRMQMNGEFIAVSSAATEATGKTEEINLSNYPTAKYVYVCYDPNESSVPSVTYKKGKLEIVIEQIESMRDVEIVMPDKIDAVVGDTLQLFYRGMILAVNPYNYDIVVDCGKGQQLPRYFTYTPNVSDVGTRSFRLMVKDVGGEMLADKTISLVTKDVPSSPSSQKNVAIFGASTTVNGEWPAEAYRRLTGSGGSPTGLALNNISFCGALTKNGAGYFGVGGWDWLEYVTAGRSAYRFQVTGVTSLSPGAVYSNNGYNFTLLEVNVTGSSGNILMYYTQTGAAPTSSGTLTKVSGNGDETITFTSYASDSANPLWDYTNNKMTFVPYANTYCDGQIDYVITLLGTNGLTVDQSNFSAKIANAKTFADTLHSEFPNAKMIILGSQVPSCHGGLGYNYGAVANSFSNRLGLMRSQFGLRKAYQDMANEEGYSSFVKYVDLASQFDSDYNYPFYQFNVNTRNTEKERIDNNGVHPAECGYMQIADAVYRVLCNEIRV